MLKKISYALIYTLIAVSIFAGVLEMRRKRILFLMSLRLTE